MDDTISKIENYFDNKISNLDVNYKKMYELSKYNTKLVLNYLTCGLVTLGVGHISLALFPPLLVIPGTMVIVKTIKNTININKTIRESIKVLKK